MTHYAARLRTGTLNTLFAVAFVASVTVKVVEAIATLSTN